MKNVSKISHNTDELKKIILENPDLPIVIFAGKEASNYDFNTTLCSYVQVYVGEFLDIKVEEDIEDRIYEDREELKDKLWEYYFNKFDGTEKEFDDYINKKLDYYEPYWKQCIILYVDN